MTQFSVIIPTLNEVDNIDPILTRLFALNRASGSFEVIIVDDGSQDGTPDKVHAWEEKANVRLVERKSKPDLTASILAGVAVAKSNVIVVMDADLSHPPERLYAVVAPVLDGSHDVAIGSRYVPGGGIEGWPLHRQWLSRIGGWLARPICDVSDATSGFFAFRRELASTISEHAHGYKILLELLLAGQGKLKVVEVPICFHDRTHGSSKLSFSHQWIYLQRLMTLAGGSVAIGTANRYVAVGLFSIIIDIGLFQLLIYSGAGLSLAHIMSFFAATAVNYTLNLKWSFQSQHSDPLRWHQLGRFLTVSVMALLMRGGVLAWLVYGWHIPPLLAIFPAVAATAAINYLGHAFYVFPVNKNSPSLDIRWRVTSVGVVAFIILLRLIYLGQAQLIPDEAYYWNYAQHMDLSFYDHPPMVAWLIWLGTAIAGDNEFGVRIGAFLSGLITMGYLYALAKNLYDKSTAMRTVLLLAILPFSFATGIVMTADAPLLAAWAATLYYMERALIAGHSSAWLGMGIAFGLGILSKYTLGLLGIAALLFVILDPIARHWLRRPHPYLAALLALVLFLPVIIWNMEHQWASISFQSSRLKGVGDDQFSTHLLFVNLLVLLTPVGLLAAALALRPGSEHDNSQSARRRRLFVWIFTGTPLAVFFVLSMFDSLRFHWTAPLWLAALPTIAWMMGQNVDLRSIKGRLQAAWRPTIVTCMFVYAFILHYVVLGIPGIPYPAFMKYYFWRETTHEIEQIVEEVRLQSGQEPLVVGMNKWSIASTLFFYNRKDEPMDIRSRNMFGDSGAMYQFWHPAEPPTTRSIILVGMDQQQVEYDRSGNDITSMLDQPGPVQSMIIMREDIPLRRVYYRIAQGYLGYQSTPESVISKHN
ncbi:glycosyltransferase family 39 protein [Nitrosomonas supralitoralis]|uniref:Dolichyl-phosphate beta-D-mannosyltransferase n=1 Tax=Nitrosomonas supralitoralis TaxID=2116706 RepID=A0A2P7NT44_9PROT|nr:glycosyltransferase family 39 protein [Nitrosomonas supralitoralis]PSJ16642.1 dolichyl-phosphate beta-D-mannosyltransferase [Nitrosomonas supralitoralis]